MTERRGRAIEFTRPGEPLRTVEAAIPDPAPGEVLIRLELAGICGSDIHRLAGDTPYSGDPVCFGHEGVGIVSAIGAGAGHDRAGSPLAIGDRVYWFPVPQCGECRACREKLSVSFCESFVWPLPAGERHAATFQDYATIGPRVPMYRIPEGTSSAAVIAFGCAMPTAIGGMMRLGDISGDVVVQGTGPLGLAAIVLAAHAGARVIAIGDPDNRLAMARRLGARETLSLGNTSAAERKARILDVTGGRGPATVIEASGHISAFAEGIDLVATHGRYLIMGLYSGQATVPVNPVHINNRNLTIIGSLGYPEEALARTVALATELGERHDFASLVTHRFPLDRTGDAIAVAASGVAIKAVVIGPDTPTGEPR